MINQDVESLSIEKDEKSSVYDFLFKLKIWNEEVMDQNLGFEINDETQTTRVCPICSKGFSSGKALGGHMRIHKPFLKKEAAKPNIMSKKPNGTPTCIVCGKKFPSDKSLFGHMRSHPERHWRGVCPPPSWTAPPEPVDLTQSLMGWAVRAKRGRKAVLKQEEDDERLRDCVYYLMMLAHGNVVHDSDDENLDHTDVATCDVINGDQSEGGDLVSVEKKRKRKRMKPKQSDNDEKVVVHNCKYRCSTCDKSFSTHQALGGHRSSAHKSNEIVIPRVVLSTSPIESRRVCCKMLDFDLDLNREPRDEEETDLVSYSC